MHKYKLFLLVLLPRNNNMHKYKTFPICFTAKKYTNLLPKLIAVHTHQSWKQKWHMTIVIPRMHCNVTPDVSFWGGLVHTTTCYPTPKMHLKKFSNSGRGHSTACYPTVENAFKTFCQPLGVHSTTFHPTLRIVRFTLISFMGFPAILNTLKPFQICIFNRN